MKRTPRNAAHMVDQPATWQIEIHRLATKDLVRFRSVREQFEHKVSVLETTPDAGPPLTGLLRGARALTFSLPGMGECRVADVKLSGARICLLFVASTRENFYREAERRYEALLRSEPELVPDDAE